MNGDRRVTLAMIAVGALWALALVWGTQAADLPFIPFAAALPVAFLAPGLVLAAMIARVAQRRFLDDAPTGGTGGRGEVDRRVLQDTLEQVVLALALWPFVAATLGGAVVIAMGVALAFWRLLFWAGAYLSPALRGLGFAAGFLPTPLAALWAVRAWLG